MTKPQPASGATVLHVTRVKKAGQERAPVQLAQAEPGAVHGEQSGAPESTAGADAANAAAPAAEGGLGFWGWAAITGLGAMALGAARASEGSAADTAAPTLTGSTPSTGATAVGIGSSIVLTFSETVQAGSGDIVISNGVDTHTISVTDTVQVAINNRTVTIYPVSNLQSNSTYHVQMTSGVLTDRAGNAFNGLVNADTLQFDTQDLIAPTLSGIATAGDGAAAQVDTPVVLAFSETVQAGSGDIVISNGADTRIISVADTTQVTVNGSTVTINPTADLQSNSQYRVQVAGGAFLDLAGNLFAGVAGSAAPDFHTAGIDLSAVVAGRGGFVINGQCAGDLSGVALAAAGDVNGDGLADLIVGAPESAPAARSVAGRSYVVFGRGDGVEIDLSSVAAGIGGFVINGQCALDHSGSSVSGAGDVNGDGLEDLLVGAWSGDPAGGSEAGRSYLVFGKSDGAAIDLSAVALGSGGFAINGRCAGDYSGFSVCGVGDVNGDGLTDLMVGAHGSAPTAGFRAGCSYVVFGKSTGAAIDLSAVSAGIGGFVINGQSFFDSSGKSVSGAGDVNGDGLADLLIGAENVNLQGQYGAGRSYVVFGKGDGLAIDLSAVVAGNGGFVINGQCTEDYSGGSVAGAGDVNGDGLADLVVGAGNSDPAAGSDAGRSYVVFGKSSGAPINLSAIAAGNGGFVINGQCLDDYCGRSVSAAGDMNGDGLADLLLGVAGGDPAAGAAAGRSYVVFGKSGGSAIDLSAVALGSGGFVINGRCAWDLSGIDVSRAGDVNGDGLADLLVGTRADDPAAGANAGRSYVILGSTRGAFAPTAVDQYGTAGVDAFSDGGTAGTLVTGDGDDTLTATAASILCGGAGNDVFVIDATMITALQGLLGAGGNLDRLCRIDGGSGIDTISLSGSGLAIDLIHIANQAASNPDGGSRIDSIEKIDLTGTGDNTLVLQLLDVLDMGSANTFVTTGRQQLLVTGNTGDTLDIADGAGTAGWTHAGTASIGAVSYNVWNHDTSLATIYVNPNITVI